MAAYATVEELAAALRVVVSPTNEAGLQACLDAAAVEIRHAADTPEADPDADPPVVDPLAGDPLANRVNVLRGVEWHKSNDAAFGVIGYDGVGSLQAPRDGFNRHAYTLAPLKAGWGVA